MYSSTFFSTAFSNFLHWFYGFETDAELGAETLSLISEGLMRLTGLSLVSVEFLD